MYLNLLFSIIIPVPVHLRHRLPGVAAEVGYLAVAHLSPGRALEHPASVTVGGPGYHLSVAVIRPHLAFASGGVVAEEAVVAGALSLVVPVHWAVLPWLEAFVTAD